MADTSQPVTDQSGGSPDDASALSDIATNGNLLNQNISALIQAVGSLGDITLPVANGGTGRDDITAHNLLVGNGTDPVNFIAPSSTSGVPLISQGSSSDPAFGTAVVAGGGTGLTATTPYAVLCGGSSSSGALQSIASVGTAGQILSSNGASALPTMMTRSAAASDYIGNTTNTLFITPNTVWNATGYVALTDGSTIAVDMSTGFNFSVSIAGNRTLSNATNAKTGQSGCFKVTASSADRTIDLGTQYLFTSDLSFPVTITSGTTAYIFYFVDTSTRVLITSVLNNPT